MNNFKIIKAQLDLLSDTTGVGFICTNGGREFTSSLYRNLPTIEELKKTGVKSKAKYEIRYDKYINYTVYTNAMKSRYLYIFDIGESENSLYRVETDVTSEVLFNRSKEVICKTISIISDVFEVTEELDKAELNKYNLKPKGKNATVKNEMSVLRLTRTIKNRFSIIKISLINSREMLYSCGTKAMTDIQYDIFRIISAEKSRLGLDSGNTLTEHTHLIDDNSTLVLTTKYKEARDVLIGLEDKFRVLTSNVPLKIGICIVHYPLVSDLSQILNYLTIGLDSLEEVSGSGIVSHIDMSDKLGEEALSDFQLSEELREVVKDKKNELIVMYQPKVNAITQEVIGAEGLVRWINPSRGFIPPDDFIPLSERMGLIKEIGRIVLHQVVSDSNTLKELTGQKLRLGVNVSAIQLDDDRFINELVEMIEDGVCDPELLDLEITESVAALDIAHVIELLSRVRKLGVTISLDDFGTGYSSLNYVKNLPIDTLKIDKSFVDTVMEEDTLCSDIIDISKKLRLKTVAEGVEHKEQWHRLRDFNCDILQGYYFSRPIEFSELIERLSNPPQKVSS